MRLVFNKSFLFFLLVLFCVSFAFAQTEREKGIELYNQGKNKEAVAALEKASNRKEIKTDADVWNFLGLAYTKEEAFKKAIKAFEKAVGINPQNAIYQTNLAYVYFLNNKLDKAQAASTKAIELNSQNATAYYIRGAASVWEGDNVNAINDADRAIAINPDHSLAYVLKSDALLLSFSSRVGGGSRPFEEVGLLQQAKEVLEICLKNCRNNQQSELQQKKMDALEVFYKYFSKNRDAALNQTSDALPNQTVSVSTPPDPSVTPLKILKKTPAAYTNNARTNGIEGTIRIAVFFSESGRVTHTLILKGLGGGLNENAVKAAQQIKFEPATKDGKPFSQIKIVEYSFDIY